MDAPITLLTVGDIGRLLGVPFYKVRYVLLNHHEIQPVMRAANCRLYGDTGLAQIRKALDEAKRPAKKGEPLTV